MYVVLVRLSVKAEQSEKFEKAILKNASASVREEPDCRRFDVCRSESSPSEWMFYEVYTDSAAFDYHHRQPHFLEYNAVAEEAVYDKQITTYYLKNP